MIILSCLLQSFNAIAIKNQQIPINIHNKRLIMNFEGKQRRISLNKKLPQINEPIENLMSKLKWIYFIFMWFVCASAAQQFNSDERMKRKVSMGISLIWQCWWYLIVEQWRFSVCVKALLFGNNAQFVQHKPLLISLNRAEGDQHVSILLNETLSQSEFVGHSNVISKLMRNLNIRFLHSLHEIRRLFYYDEFLAISKRIGSGKWL